ncbi:MAG: hypothetical protein QM504_08115 [Pseudomonadota bacterium]
MISGDLYKRKLDGKIVFIRKINQDMVSYSFSSGWRNSPIIECCLHCFNATHENIKSIMVGDTFFHIKTMVKSVVTRIYGRYISHRVIINGLPIIKRSYINDYASMYKVLVGINDNSSGKEKKPFQVGGYFNNKSSDRKVVIVGIFNETVSYSRLDISNNKFGRVLSTHIEYFNTHYTRG